MKPEAVFFDLFETLITEFADGRRRSNRKHDYVRLLGMTSEAFKTEWGKRSAQRMNGTFPSFPDVIRDILTCRELRIDEEAVRYLHQARMEEKRIPFDDVQPEITELLEALRNKGIKIGLISNCTQEEVAAWEDSGLAAYFDDRVFSYEAKCSKPDAEIYALACRRLGVKPERCMFVGDGGSDELEGASRAGMRPYHAFWYNSYIKSDFRKLTAPLDVLDELD